LAKADTESESDKMELPAVTSEQEKVTAETNSNGQEMPTTEEQVHADIMQGQKEETLAAEEPVKEEAVTQSGIDSLIGEAYL